MLPFDRRCAAGPFQRVDFAANLFIPDSMPDEPRQATQGIGNVACETVLKSRRYIGMSSAFDNISIRFGRTRVDFQGDMLH